MNSCVLDSSALLALLNDEPGAAMVQAALPGAIISAVNYAEVVTRLSLLGMPPNESREALSMLGLEIIPFDAEQAFQTGALAKETRQLGLSLGDRACLALSRARGLPALTADRVWQALEPGMLIQVIR